MKRELKTITVLKPKIDVDGRKTLPLGDYRGMVETGKTTKGRSTQRWISRVIILLSKDDMVRLDLAPSQSAFDLEIDVTEEYKAGLLKF